jgi:hypothetical protein
MTTNLRDRVYDALTSDPTLIALGLTTDTLYPAGTDTIQAETFAVMRWGVTEVGPGNDSDARVENMNLWAYNRAGNYTPITGILRAARSVLLGLAGTPINPGWIIGLNWNGDSTDLFDDGYKAWTRNSAYRIAATGGW